MRSFFETLAAAGRLHPLSRPERHGVRVERDLCYGDPSNPFHRLDVWRPTGDGVRPCIFLVHGGGFRILSKNTHWLMALMFARAGYVVFTSNYRLAPDHPFPAAIEDVFQAWSWVLEHAADHGADPSRIAVAGESAGANLVLSLTNAACFELEDPLARAVFERGVVPSLALPACGLLEVSQPERYLSQTHIPSLFRDRIQTVCEDYLGPLGTQVRSEAVLANPLSLLESDVEAVRPLPSMYIAVGSADPIADDSYRLGRALDRRGVPHSIDVYRGETHAFHAFIWRQAAQRCWQTHVEVLNDVLPL